MSSPGVVKVYDPDLSAWVPVFVGRRGTSGVVKSDTPPSDEEVLWVDTSETATFGAPILSSWDVVRDAPGGTTTNYEWPKPADADVVKDGAQAVRDLADAVDSGLQQIEDSLPRGWVHAYIHHASSSETIDEMVWIARTVFLEDGRRYRWSFSGLAEARHPTGNRRIVGLVREDNETGAFIARWLNAGMLNSDSNQHNTSAVGGFVSFIDGEGANFTFAVTIRVESGAGGVRGFATANTPAVFLVEDIGPTP